MIGQPLSLVCILLISYFAISSNLVLLKSVNVTGKEIKHEASYARGVEPKDFKSSKYLQKRNTFDEYGNFDLYYKDNTKESKVWFHFTSSPTTAYHRGLIDEQAQSVDQLSGVDFTRTEHLFYGTLKPYTYKPPAKRLEEFNISHVGCYSTWEKQFTGYEDANETHKYDSKQLHTTCAKRCKEKGDLMQISFVKGVECKCAATYAFDSKQIHPSFCNIPCPIKDFHPPPSDALIPNPCGGNVGYSVYCSSGPNPCTEILHKAEEERKVIQAESRQIKIDENSVSVVIPDQFCAKCNYSENLACMHSFIFADFDYFPVNSPAECIAFCSNTLSFLNRQKAELSRPPTKYALLTWWKDQDTDLPVCSCNNETVRDLYRHTAVSDCNMNCPGARNTLCGGQEKEFTFHATIFCTEHLEEGKCNAISTTSSPPTTTRTPEPPPVHPCMSEEMDCEEEVPDTTQAPDESTSFEPTTSEQIPSTTVTTETEPTSTTTTTTAPTPTHLPSTTTTMKSSPSTPTPIASCRKCKMFDRRGFYWEACTGEMAIVQCIHLNIGSNTTGHAFWKCSTNGVFETDQPDVSNCTSVWLEEKHEEIDKLQDLVETNDFVQKLADACRNSGKPNSSSIYYGHEISSIVSLVEQSVAKAREFLKEDSSEAKFVELESVVDKAIDLNTFLLSNHEPWRDLALPQKSAISTDIIENTEEAIFHLTQEVHNEPYVRTFLLNHTEPNKILILAESLNKQSVPQEKNYEFPSRVNRDEYDSYIKLPTGWISKIRTNEVEIAAMSINSEFVSSIMPGQYEHLVSSSTLDAAQANTKLMNGKLMSLSFMSSPDQDHRKLNTSLHYSRPSISFNGKGVEIVFHHDIEAWGEDILNVPRKLHNGELPKAVLGSSDCVYWNTEEHSWSSKGCKIVKANRYETVCECNHLTSFAILMDVHRYVGKDYGLELLTLILCPASEVALFVSIIVLSAVSGLQKIRATITKNLSICLLVGNALVLFVLDRNYFDMSEGLCIGAAMVTHYIYLAAFFWMLVEGIQLYRMVVHVFDSGRSYIKHFGVFAYGSPLIIIAITASVGYLQGDKPYGGDVYCWLDGPYIWSFMGPVAVVTTVNLIILFIALKTAYQVQQSKIHSQIFIMGKIRSCKTWFKGCFSLTVILGLTWLVGFFTLMKSPGGTIAAYIFTILNASQGIFIFVFNCVLNEKVRSSTQRNLSTYLPSWLSSSSSNRGGKDGSIYGKRPFSSIKSGDLDTKSTRRTSESSQKSSSAANPRLRAKVDDRGVREPVLDPSCNGATRGPRRSTKVEFLEDKNYRNAAIRTESIGTISSSTESIPNCSSVSDNGHISSDNSQNTLISRPRF